MACGSSASLMLEKVESLSPVVIEIGFELETKSSFDVLLSDVYSIPLKSSKGFRKEGFGVILVAASGNGGRLVSESRIVTNESVGNGLRSGCWYKLLPSCFMAAPEF